MSLNISPGRSFPLGATVSSEGVNFCIYSSTCTGLELLLFNSASDSEPTQRSPLIQSIIAVFTTGICLFPVSRQGKSMPIVLMESLCQSGGCDLILKKTC